MTRARERKPCRGSSRKRHCNRPPASGPPQLVVTDHSRSGLSAALWTVRPHACHHPSPPFSATYPLPASWALVTDRSRRPRAPGMAGSRATLGGRTWAPLDSASPCSTGSSNSAAPSSCGAARFASAASTGPSVKRRACRLDRRPHCATLKEPRRVTRIYWATDITSFTPSKGPRW